MEIVPSIGRTVHYTLTENDAEQINRRRTDALVNRTVIVQEAKGYVAHVGNKAEAGQVYPMVIVRVWGTTPASAVNGQVFLDGTDVLWKTSVCAGNAPGSFAWPQRT